MTDPFSPLNFPRGPAMANRFMLAPLTNCQSLPNGHVSDDETEWLEMRAEHGFGLTMTCGAMVQPIGRGFPGQIGAYADDQLEGMTRLAGRIQAAGSLSSVQLHHAGARADRNFIDTPVSSSISEEWQSRALTIEEVEQAREDFVAAAVRAEKAGFHGVELHGAHGYLIAQFLSPEINQRDDCYGGSLENRSRFLLEIIEGIRWRCGRDFQLGVRLSPERWGGRTGEMLELAQQLCNDDKLDYLDVSLWDIRKQPEEADYRGRGLLSWFAGLRRGNTRLGCAGKINSADTVNYAMAEGVDFVLIGRAAILHYDFPEQVRNNPAFVAMEPPVTADYLQTQGVTAPFVEYLRSMRFVQ